jgi:hypothetical protein
MSNPTERGPGRAAEAARPSAAADRRKGDAAHATLVAGDEAHEVEKDAHSTGDDAARKKRPGHGHGTLVAGDEAHAVEQRPSSGDDDSDR